MSCLIPLKETLDLNFIKCPPNQVITVLLKKKQLCPCYLVAFFGIKWKGLFGHFVLLKANWLLFTASFRTIRSYCTDSVVPTRT